jgi:hypothetical protein
MSANLKTITLDRLADRLRLASRSSIRLNRTRKNLFLHHNLSILKCINEPNDVKLSLFYKILMKKVIFQRNKNPFFGVKIARIKEVASPREDFIIFPTSASLLL